MSPQIVGVSVSEVDGRASPAIQPAPTSVAAFSGMTERGVPNSPVRISDLKQFQTQFGNHLAGGLLAYAVEGFFLNGGREAYVNRVVGAASAAASVNLLDRQATQTATLRVAAGYRGREDPGDWGERLRIDVRDDPRASTTLTDDTATDATSAKLASLRDIRVGTVVRLADGANAFYRKVTSVDTAGNEIGWSGTVGPPLDKDTATVTTGEFQLVVRYRAVPTGGFQVVEQWRSLSMETDSPDYAAGRINHAFTGSRYITVTDLSGDAPSGEENPVPVAGRPLTNGADAPAGPLDHAGDAGQRTGLHALDTVQVQLLAVPDVHALGDADRELVVRAALDYCAGRGDCMFVGSAPDRGTSSGVQVARALSDYTEAESDYLATVAAYAAEFQASKVYGALYTPWIRVGDPIAAGAAPSRFVPADGHVMGVYARTELERGIWKAPAGIAAQVRGALDVAAIFTDGQHTELVREAWVNGIRPLPGAGITVVASRTLSTDTRWWFVNVRLLFNFVKASLRDGLRFVRQEPHTGELRRTVSFNVVRPFLLGLWRRGAFGTGPPERLFEIKCDAENNPPDQVDQGNFFLEVYFYPVRPAETVQIIVGQQPSGASASEA
jgi:uncharacterized protein